MNQREKAERYDMMGAVYTNKRCPHCKKQFELYLNGFYCLDLFRGGLVYKCPYCNTELYLSHIGLELKKVVK